MSPINPGENPAAAESASAVPRSHPHESHPAGPDPVHPSIDAESTHRAHASAPPEHGARLGEAPAAADRGVPAVLGSRVVALQVGYAAAPVAVHHWVHGRVESSLLIPVEAQVRARAGRLTFIEHDGTELKLTVLAPEEGACLPLGCHWPVVGPEPAQRAASRENAGERLVLPSGIARAAHISGERNRVVAELVRRLREVSPATVVQYGQGFGFVRAQGRGRPSGGPDPASRRNRPPGSGE